MAKKQNSKEKKEIEDSTPKNAKTSSDSKSKKKLNRYGADDITVLEGLEPVRKRPGMYIGSTGMGGLHHLLWEVFDNGRDEAMMGYADHIEVSLLPDYKVRVVDNGRGIPIEKHRQTGVSTLETIMTTLHAGGKFGEEGYKIAGGLHGVGVSVVNALSEYVKVEVHKDGNIYEQEYSKGIKKVAVKRVGVSKKTGTIVTFKPDHEIFGEREFSWDKIVEHLRQQAYLEKGLRISILDLRKREEAPNLKGVFCVKEFISNVPSITFYFEGGVYSLIKFYNKHQKPIHKNIFYVEKELENNIVVEIALQYVDDISSHIVAFANNTYNPEGGMHLTGFKTALTRTINNYSKKNRIVKEDEDNFTGDDVLEGLTSIVSIRIPEAQFEGQTKGKLGNVEARSAVESVFSESFEEFLEENPNIGRSIVNKSLLAFRSRKAARAAKENVLRKGALEGMTLPGKLSDCQIKDASRSEIFIVEGDSAGGSSKMGRDRATQAILPLKGKILNVERARIDRMLASVEIKALIVAMGAGIGDTFDIEKLRYHKIIIATDADVDGAHIRTLLLTLFYRYFVEIIKNGYLYIAQPPLYKIKKGKETTYVYSEEEKNKIVGKEEVFVEDVESTKETSEENSGENEDKSGKEEETKKSTKAMIQRYKGLGEMNPEELWETTMDPKRRMLNQVNIEDARETDKIFDTLMGTDVPSRKSFIKSNAEFANIDI